MKQATLTHATKVHAIAALSLANMFFLHDEIIDFKEDQKQFKILVGRIQRLLHRWGLLDKKLSNIAYNIAYATVLKLERDITYSYIPVQCGLYLLYDNLDTIEKVVGGRDTFNLDEVDALVTRISEAPQISHELLKNSTALSLAMTDMLMEHLNSVKQYKKAVA